MSKISYREAFPDADDAKEILTLNQLSLINAGYYAQETLNIINPDDQKQIDSLVERINNDWLKYQLAKDIEQGMTVGICQRGYANDSYPKNLMGKMALRLDKLLFGYEEHVLISNMFINPKHENYNEIANQFLSESTDKAVSLGAITLAILDIKAPSTIIAVSKGFEYAGQYERFNLIEYGIYKKDIDKKPNKNVYANQQTFYEHTSSHKFSFPY